MNAAPARPRGGRLVDAAPDQIHHPKTEGGRMSGPLRDPGEVNTISRDLL